ncbi:MAG: helix-turn-helix transcriptional regulator, partial [Myxococcota bacterium]
MTRRRRALAGRRIAVGLTQEQLADALEMDVSAIKRWELGQAMPHPNVRRQLADILEVSLSELAAVLVEPSNDLGITALSSGHETRISEYKQCLRAASGDIIISGTSL